MKNGSVSITGPLKRLPRLYNKEWISAKASMSKLERYISEIVDVESQGSVAHKYSSPPGDHFSILLMLGDIDLLYLIVLEATGDNQDSINIYRRAGILKLEYIDPSSYLLPRLIVMRKKVEISITAQIGLRKKLRRV